VSPKFLFGEQPIVDIVTVPPATRLVEVIREPGYLID
jgi:hypothetical protein